MEHKKHKELLPVYLKGLSEGKYTLRQASESTGYSTRWLSKLKNEYKLKGDKVLEHVGKGHPAYNKIPEKTKLEIFKIYQSRYKDVNFAYFREALEKYEAIKISLPSLRNIMKEYDIVSPKARKPKRKKPRHEPRPRRINFGDLLQTDGTPYEWFYKFKNTKKYCITGFIDDATSIVTALYMTENECLYGYMEALRQTCLNFGMPREIYSDKAAIFRTTPKEKHNLTIHEQLEGLTEKPTQWQRILSELGINQILANSPEAKGRIERLWETLQGRLPQEFYLNGIDTVEKANEFLKTYILEFNSQFSVQPKSNDSFFIPIEKDILDEILCARFERKTDKTGCFSFHNFKFKIEDADRVCNIKFYLCISEKGIRAKIKGKYYHVTLLDDPRYDLDENIPEVIKNIIFKYMYENSKEIAP